MHLTATTLLALGALLAPLTLTAPAARADRCGLSDRSPLVIRTGRDHHRGGDRFHRKSFHRQHVSAPSGYYKKVYRPAVYRTYYDHHGRAHRVCVRAARYDRVWVSAGRSHRGSYW